MKHLRRFNLEIKESKSQIKDELEGNDYQMVSGIIDILKKSKIKKTEWK